MTDQFINAQGTADTAEPVHEAPVVPAATAPVETADTTKMPRLPSLIGLRGVGALTVVISHCINTDPGLVHPHLWSVGWWFSYTPVNLLWDGDEAVLMFFVLSGFVLARPFTRREQSQSYLAYYPRRLLRLYPPLWGGLIFTFLLTLVESRHIIPAATYWVNNHSNFHPSTLQDALLPRVGTTFDGPLWSLRWEILFSLSSAGVHLDRACLQALGRSEGHGRTRSASPGSGGHQGSFGPDQRRHSLPADVRRRGDHRLLRDRSRQVGRVLHGTIRLEPRRHFSSSLCCSVTSQMRSLL